MDSKNHNKFNINKNSIPKNNTELLLIFKKELLELIKLLKIHQKTWNIYNRNILEDSIPKFFGKNWNLKISDLEMNKDHLINLQNQIEEEEMQYKKNKLLKLREIELLRINNIHQTLKELPDKYYEITDMMYTPGDRPFNKNTFANLRTELAEYVQEDRMLIINQTKEKIREIYFLTIGNVLTKENLKEFVEEDKKKKEELIEENLLEGEEGKENIKALVKEVLKPYIKKIKEQGKTILNLKQIWNWNPNLQKPKNNQKPKTSTNNPNLKPKWTKQGEKKKNIGKTPNFNNLKPKPNYKKTNHKYIPGYNPVKKDIPIKKKSNYKPTMKNSTLLKDLMDNHKPAPKNNKGWQSDMRNPFKLHAGLERYNLLYPPIK